MFWDQNTPSQFIFVRSMFCNKAVILSDNIGMCNSVIQENLIQLSFFKNPFFKAQSSFGHSRLPARRASRRAEASRGLEEVMAVCGRRDGAGLKLPRR